MKSLKSGLWDTSVADEKRTCIGCSHLEDLDYIHGCGMCAALEGETVILTEECVCPDDVLKTVERLQSSMRG